MRQDDEGISVPKISHIALITSDACACAINVSIIGNLRHVKLTPLLMESQRVLHKHCLVLSRTLRTATLNKITLL